MSHVSGDGMGEAVILRFIAWRSFAFVHLACAGNDFKIVHVIVVIDCLWSLRLYENRRKYRKSRKDSLFCCIAASKCKFSASVVAPRSAQ